MVVVLYVVGTDGRAGGGGCKELFSLLCFDEGEKKLNFDGDGGDG